MNVLMILFEFLPSGYQYMYPVIKMVQIENCTIGVLDIEIPQERAYLLCELVIIIGVLFLIVHGYKSISRAHNRGLHSLSYAMSNRILQQYMTRIASIYENLTDEGAQYVASRVLCTE